MTIANPHGITANPVAVPNVPRLALSMDLGVEEFIGHSDHFLAFKNLMVSTQGFGFKRVTSTRPIFCADRSAPSITSPFARGYAESYLSECDPLLEGLPENSIPFVHAGSNFLFEAVDR
jgi:hypothetical protein